MLFLILAFFNAAALFLIAGAEFLAMILVIVYVGAVAVLFLFVVMMLDVNFSELRDGFQRYAPVGATIGAVPVRGIGAGAWAAGSSRRRPGRSGCRRRRVRPRIPGRLGHLIYTDYVFLFQSAGLILMVAMIGAIVLTHRDRGTTKRQNIARQNARAVGDTLELVKVTSGTRDRGDEFLAAEGRGAGFGGGRRDACARGRLARAGRALMGPIGVGHYLAVGAVLLVMGIFGIFLNRKNVIVIMMSIELMLLAVNVNLVGFSSALGRFGGAGVRAVRVDGGGGGGCDRVGDRGGVFPQSRVDPSRRRQHDAGLRCTTLFRAVFRV